jgi:hypothetical protein
MEKADELYLGEYGHESDWMGISEMTYFTALGLNRFRLQRLWHRPVIGEVSKLENSRTKKMFLIHVTENCARALIYRNASD